MDASDRRWSPETEQVLLAAGWYPNRDVGIDLLGLTGSTEPEMLPIARRVLAEFGGLVIGGGGAGVSSARSQVTMDPSLAAGMNDSFAELQSVVGARLAPLGEVDGGHAILLVSELGALYIMFDDILEVAPTVDEGLERLIRGRGTTGQWTSARE